MNEVIVVEGEVLLKLGITAPSMYGLVAKLNENEHLTWLQPNRTHTQIEGVGPQSYPMHRFAFEVSVLPRMALLPSWSDERRSAVEAFEKIKAAIQ